MYVVKGIAYADEIKPTIKVCGVRPLDNFRLWVRFNTGEAKIFDFKPLLKTPAFVPLADKSIFRSVYINHGMTLWNNGDIDIAPEVLYEKGIDVTEEGIV